LPGGETREGASITVGCLRAASAVRLRSKLECSTTPWRDGSRRVLPSPGISRWPLCAANSRRSTTRRSTCTSEADYIEETFGEVARRHQVALGVGACEFARTSRTGARPRTTCISTRTASTAGSTASSPYLPTMTSIQGRRPAVPETDYQRRIKPVDLPKVGLRVGTVFCWEIYARALVPAYAFNDVNLLVHPIKFAPRGWSRRARARRSRLSLRPGCQVRGLDQPAQGRRAMGSDVAQSRSLANTWDIGAKTRRSPTCRRGPGHDRDSQHREHRR